MADEKELEELQGDDAENKIEISVAAFGIIFGIPYLVCMMWFR